MIVHVDVVPFNIHFGACPVKPSIALETHRAAIRSVVLRHRACNARVFGSVLHGTDQDGSDIDLLVDHRRSDRRNLEKIKNGIEELLRVGGKVIEKTDKDILLGKKTI